MLDMETVAHSDTERTDRQTTLKITDRQKDSISISISLCMLVVRTAHGHCPVHQSCQLGPANSIGDDDATHRDAD
jgi:hypothetical protein